MKSPREIFKAIIFDLDGTLINSIIDIHLALNEMLIRNSLPQISQLRCTELVGNGLTELVEKALPETINSHKYVNERVAEMRQIYKTRWLDQTTLYEGVGEMLDFIQSKGLKMTVLSNKHEETTKSIVRTLLPNWNFCLVLGATSDRPLKPDPAAIHYICETLQIERDEILFVGDGDTDMIAAKRADISSAAVSWGYRSREFLLEFNPDYVLNHPSELIELLS